MAKDHSTLVRRLRQQGFDVAHTNGGHLKVKGPKGGIVFMAASPGRGRAHANAVSRLKRLGFRP